MKKLTLSLAIVMIILVLSACGAKKYEPQAINEATDKCAVCNMQVKDDQFATQAVLKDGKSLKFDDIGCYNEWKSKNGTEQVGATFVRDYHSKEWIELEKAYYVYDKSFKSPMAYGIYSFKDKATAEKFIAENGKGKLMTGSELGSHTWERNSDKMKHMKDSHKPGDEGKQDMKDMKDMKDGHGGSEAKKEEPKVAH